MGTREQRNSHGSLAKQATPNYYDYEAEKGWAELLWRIGNTSVFSGYRPGCQFIVLLIS